MIGAMRVTMVALRVLGVSSDLAGVLLPALDFPRLGGIVAKLCANVFVLTLLLLQLLFMIRPGMALARCPEEELATELRQGY